jgi:hypothetical protein
MSDLVNVAPGQCRLDFVSTTQLKLSRFAGAYLPLKIAGVWEAKLIPSGGVTLSNSGLTAATRYYIYAFDNAGTLTLEASTTAHAKDTDTGVEIKSGDASRTLVGLAFMGAGSPGVFLAQALGTLSFFNRALKASRVNAALYNSRNNAAYGEIDTGFRCHFVNWADDVPVASITTVHGANGAADGWGAIYLDGSTQFSEQYHGQGAGDFSPMTLVDGITGVTDETDHYVTMFVKGSTTIFVGGNQLSNKMNSTVIVSVMG